MTFRQVTAAAATMTFVFLVLQPVIARSQPKGASLAEKVRRIETALSLYAESYDNQFPVSPEQQKSFEGTAKTVANTAPEAPESKHERQYQALMTSQEVADMWSGSQAASLIDSYSDRQDTAAAALSPLAAALAYCDVPDPVIYDLDMDVESLNSCYKMADVFGLDEVDFCSLVFAEASMMNPAKDQMQNALASAGLNPSAGLKNKDSTTIGCAQMSVATALNVLTKLREGNPQLYERLGIPEDSPELPNILLRRLAADCEFAVQMQAAYAYVNTIGIQDERGEPRPFAVFVKEIFNKHNEELHRRFDCLGEALRNPAVMAQNNATKPAGPTERQKPSEQSDLSWRSPR